MYSQSALRVLAVTMFQRCFGLMFITMGLTSTNIQVMMKVSGIIYWMKSYLELSIFVFIVILSVLENIIQNIHCMEEVGSCRLCSAPTATSAKGQVTGIHCMCQTLANYLYSGVPNKRYVMFIMLFCIFPSSTALFFSSYVNYFAELCPATTINVLSGTTSTSIITVDPAADRLRHASKVSCLGFSVLLLMSNIQATCLLKVKKKSLDCSRH